MTSDFSPPGAEWNVPNPTGEQLFVVVWEGDCMVAAIPWVRWVETPIQDRPWDTRMVKARDALSAFVQAMGDNFYF